MHLLRRGCGTPVLFIHGIPTNHRLWNGVIQQMQASFSCFAVDLPGLGQSPSEPYGPDYLQRVAERIEGIRRQNNIEKWHVVGHDAGSAVATQYAHSFPNSVDRLALLSPALFPELKPFYLFELLRTPVIGECLAPLVHPLFWNVGMRRALRNEEGLVHASLADFSEPFSGRLGGRNFLRVLRWGKPAEILGPVSTMLPRLKAHTLIFQGSRDPAIPASFAHRAHSLIRNSQLVQVDSGHFIPLNRPNFVASHLHSFFTQPLTA